MKTQILISNSISFVKSSEVYQKLIFKFCMPFYMFSRMLIQNLRSKNNVGLLSLSERLNLVNFLILSYCLLIKTCSAGVVVVHILWLKPLVLNFAAGLWSSLVFPDHWLFSSMIYSLIKWSLCNWPCPIVNGSEHSILAMLFWKKKMFIVPSLRVIDLAIYGLKPSEVSCPESCRWTLVFFGHFDH